MWTKIRTFGELQILTRASYIMLILVPLLAGVWPAVKSGINEYNGLLEDSKAALESASQQLEFAVVTLEDIVISKERVEEITKSLDFRINKIIDNYSEKAIEKHSLPSAWALGFFASLSVMIGHLIYQSLAPSLIKRATVHDYAREELRSFVEHPSNGQLDRAKKYAAFSETRYEKNIEKNYKEDFSRSEEERSKEKEKREELGIIEQGAIGEYLSEANSNPLAAVSSGIFYAIGLVIILYIITTQSANVYDAAWGQSAPNKSSNADVVNSAGS